MAKNQLKKIINKKSKLHGALKVLLILAILAAIMVGVYFLPPVHDRLAWRVYNLRMQIFYLFNPPGEESFTPGQQAEMEEIVQQTQTAIALAYTDTPEPSQTPTNFVSPTATPTMTPTATATPIPESKRLDGVVWEGQGFNNCGPANLSMALSYWDWQGDQYVTGVWLRPNNRDRNVMPYEMVDYIQQETNFDVILRYGGDLEMLKKFIAAGFPVLIEKGFEDEVPQGGWMGHYGVVTAYDDATETVLIQDSYVKADYAYSYARVEKFWQAFNYVYLVIYPSELESQVLSILGPHVDETYNLQQAAQKALEETETMTGKQQFFSWYNYGTNLVNMGDYYGAALAYDNAYAFLDEEYEGYNPMWRITWYQTGPYFAYYWTGRYDDLIRLADLTISYSSVEPAIEETWIWRARAKVALGDLEGGIEDYREALKWHPGWAVAEAELAALGVTP